MTRRNTEIVEKARQLVADLERTQSTEGKEPFGMILDDQDDKGAGLFPTRVIGDGWSSDEFLLLTRAELQRAKGTPASQDKSGSDQKPSEMGKCDVGGVSGSLINLKRQSAYTVMEAFSGISSCS